MARSRSGGRRPRPPRRGGGARRRGGGGASGWLLAVVCGFAIAGLFFLVYWHSGKEFDPDTLCRADGPENVTVVLLDLTDPLSPTQQSRLRTMLDREIKYSRTDTMIALGVVSEFPDRWGASFAKCKPATGEDASVLYENPALIEEQYDREFLVPIGEKIDAILTGEEESQSPIMEAMQSLVAGTPNFNDAPNERKIIIFSDMLQHSDNLSFYRNQYWEYFSDQIGMERLAGNLRDVSVKIVRIPRAGQRTPSNELVEEFWTRYFHQQRSRPPTVTSLGDL